MISLKNLWKKLSEQGLARCQTPEESRTVRIVNQSAVVIAFIMVLAAVVAYKLDFSAVYMLILFGFMLMFLSVPLINRYLHYRWGLTMIFVWASFFVFWEASAFGYESHMHYGFILLVLGVILNLYNYRPQLYWSLLGLFTLIALLYITDFSLFRFSDIPPEVQVQLDQIEFFMLLLTIGLLAFVYANNQRALVEELKATRSQLEAKNEALQKTNEELDQFVYSVSHDLRSPIASVLGLIELSHQEKNLASVKEYLKLKEKSLHKLDAFIRDLIDFSRNSRLDLQYDAIEFQPFLEEMLEEHSYSERAAQINTTLSVEQAHRFVTDQRRLKMILNNLLSNAIRYSNADRDHAYVNITVHVSTQKATIRVSDNGVGIHQKHLASIFDMFFRARENDVGSGLGLYITREATEKLGGHIHVESQLGEGSTFTVTLPNLADAALRISEEKPNPSQFNNDLNDSSVEESTPSG